MHGQFLADFYTIEEFTENSLNWSYRNIKQEKSDSFAVAFLLLCERLQRLATEVASLVFEAFDICLLERRISLGLFAYEAKL